MSTGSAPEDTLWKASAAALARNLGRCQTVYPEFAPTAMSHCAKMLRPAHAAVLMFVAISLVPGLAHAQAFGGRLMGFVLFAPAVLALILAAIAALAGKEPGPVTRALQGVLVGCASTCVGLSVSLFEVSPLWYALAMAAIFALAKRRWARGVDAAILLRLHHALDLPMLGAAYAPGLLVLLLWG